MFENIDGVIFDLDGTIIDSMGIWLQIDSDYLGERGIEVPDNIHKMTEGKSFTEVANLFKVFFKLEETVDDIKAQWIEMAKGYYEGEVKLKIGARELIEDLNLRGVKMGIGTSCSRYLTEAVVKQHSLSLYFNTIVTSCEVCKGKPAPDVFQKVAEIMEIPNHRILVFEDTIAGVKAAKAAGMKVAAVYDQYSEDDQVELQGLADYYLESMDQINKTKQIAG